MESGGIPVVVIIIRSKAIVKQRQKNLNCKVNIGLWAIVL